jgi:hypothetical protein
MSMLGRLLAGCSVLALVLVAVGAAFPEGLAALGLADFPEQLGNLAQANQQSRALDEQMDQIVARRARQEQITRELMAGRLTLGEAVTRLRSLFEPDTRFWEALRRFHDEKSDDERLARYAIAWARFVLENDRRPEQIAPTMTRLENEWQAWRAGGASADVGAVQVLPDSH